MAKWKQAIQHFYNEHALLPATMSDIKKWFAEKHPDKNLKHMSAMLSKHGCKYNAEDKKWHCRKDYTFECKKWRKKKADYKNFKKVIAEQRAPGRCICTLLTLGAEGRLVNRAAVLSVLQDHSKKRKRGFQAKAWIKRRRGEGADKHVNLCRMPHYFMIERPGDQVQLHENLWTAWKLCPKWIEKNKKK